MQIGAYKKWVAALEAYEGVIGPTQLRFIVGEYEECNVFGVLLKHIAPDTYKLAWDGLSYTFEGELFYPPEKYCKGWKLKKSCL